MDAPRHPPDEPDLAATPGVTTQPEATHPADTPGVAAGSGRSPRLLVVDDDDHNRALLTHRLTRSGHDVVTADGGEDALRQLLPPEGSTTAAVPPVDLVLLDVTMPDVDGLAVLEAVRRRFPASVLPVIMATGHTDSDEVADALRKGANDYVTKPFDFTIVLARVDAQLSLKRAIEDVRRLNRDLRAAQEQITRLSGTAHTAITDLAGWATGMAAQVGTTLGDRLLGIWLLEGEVVDGVVRLGDAPDAIELRAALKAPAGLARPRDLLLPIVSPTGVLLGGITLSDADCPLSETGHRLLEAFAHNLGAVLEMRKMRQDLARATEQRRLTRERMEARGEAWLQTCPVCRRCYGPEPSHCLDDGAALKAPGLVPRDVAGRYRLTYEAGDGAMGTVYKAEDLRLSRVVCVKLAKPQHFSNEEVRLRFQTEARVIARIDHPGVIAIFDAGELEDGSVYIVMEWLEGADLQALLRERGRGAPREVARLLRQGAAALHAAHQEHIVHRDVKPANIFLQRGADGPLVKLLDFGAAKQVEGDVSMTHTGRAIGTPRYMSPEQVMGMSVDARSDLFSFATVVYEALTGKPVTRETEPMGIMSEILLTPPAPPSSLVPTLDETVDALFAQGLTKLVDDRPGDVTVWSEALASALEALPEGEEDGTGWWGSVGA